MKHSTTFGHAYGVRVADAIATDLGQVRSRQGMQDLQTNAPEDMLQRDMLKDMRYLLGKCGAIAIEQFLAPISEESALL